MSFKAMIADLEVIANGSKKIEDGICEYMSINYTEVIDDMCGLTPYIAVRKLSMGWRHHSGDSSYPVPAPKAVLKDLNALDPHGDWFHKCELKGTLWVGNYGNKRKDLLKHLIVKLKKV